jgi:hypothetical protein
VIIAGCGETTPSNQIGPTAVSPLQSSGDATGRIAAQSIGSCPDGNAPSWLQTWTRGSTARLRWTEVAPTIDYHVVVERYDVTNQYLPVENGNLWTHSTTWAEVSGLSEGRYRAKVQTMSCGKFMGPWSEMLQFSVEGNDPPPSGDPGTPQESAEGTKAFPPGQSLIDSSGAVWTFGAPVGDGFYQVFRDGVFMFGLASQMKYHNHAVYHLGGDGNWYVWDGASWTGVGPTEP